MGALDAKANTADIVPITRITTPMGNALSTQCPKDHLQKCVPLNTPHSSLRWYCWL
jgi:hypothetical protein